MRGNETVVPAEMQFERGNFAVLFADGRSEKHTERPTMGGIRRAIGADTLDTVNLGGDYVMCVDDTGFLDKKPVNELATTLYHAVCIPGTTHPICGDVAICRDSDFE